MTVRRPTLGTPKTTVMAVRVPPELREKVEQAATTAGMSLSAYIAGELAKAVLPRQAQRPSVAVHERGTPAQATTLRDVAPASVEAVRPPPVPKPPAFADPPQGGPWDTPSRPAIPNTYPPQRLPEPTPHAAPPPAPQPQARPAPPMAPSQRPSGQGRQSAPPRSARDPYGNGQTVRPSAHPPLPSEARASAATTTELRRIGGDINRIAHAINAGVPVDAAQLVRALRELRHLFENDSAIRAARGDQTANAELGRITNNLSQIAHANQRALPPNVLALARTYQTAFLTNDAASFRAHLTTAQQWFNSYDPPHPQARQQFQGREPVHSARSEQPVTRPRGILANLQSWGRGDR